MFWNRGFPVPATFIVKVIVPPTPEDVGDAVTSKLAMVAAEAGAGNAITEVISNRARATTRRRQFGRTEVVNTAVSFWVLRNSTRLQILFRRKITHHMQM